MFSRREFLGGRRGKSPDREPVTPERVETENHSPAAPSRRDFLKTSALLTAWAGLQAFFPAKTEAASMTPEKLELAIREAMKQFAEIMNANADSLVASQKDEDTTDSIIHVLNHVYELVYLFGRNEGKPEGVTYQLFNELTQEQPPHGFREILTLLQHRFAQYGIYFNLLASAQGGKMFSDCEVKPVQLKDYPGITSLFSDETLDEVMQVQSSHAATIRTMHRTTYELDQDITSSGIPIIEISDVDARFVARTIEGVIIINRHELEKGYQATYGIYGKKNAYVAELGHNAYAHMICANELNHYCIDAGFANSDEWSNFESGVPRFKIHHGRQIREFLSDVSSLSENPRFAVITINNIFLGPIVQNEDGSYTTETDKDYSYTNQFQLMLLERLFAEKYKGREDENPVQSTFKECAALQKESEQKNETAITETTERIQKLHAHVRELDASFAKEKVAVLTEAQGKLHGVGENTPEFNSINQGAIQKIISLNAENRKQRAVLAQQIEQSNDVLRNIGTECSVRKRELVSKLISELTKEDFESIRDEYRCVAFERTESEGGSIWSELRKRRQS